MGSPVAYHLGFDLIFSHLAYSFIGTTWLPG